MQAACQDRSVGVHQHGVGDTVYSIQLCTFILPAFQVGHLRPCDVQLLDGIFPFIGILIQRYTYDFEVFAFIFSISFYNVRHFAAAWATPACPEVNQYHFAFAYIVRQFHRFSVRCQHFEVDEFLSGGSSFLLFSDILDFHNRFVILIVGGNLFQQSVVILGRVFIEALFEQHDTYRIGDILLYAFFDSLAVRLFQF